ncbi:hypothetical protein CRM22_001803 [Opisthorchis felineus]|uniref:BPTI/Kunitz inhibitor domain-containing protein n=1 Tax=Opisthorchis felineus TaxID=147828 RepID=A0A4S2M8X6_OPIFE|nr:hypothetical protein CRM22_001803 [Opisthorchis felineus]
MHRIIFVLTAVATAVHCYEWYCSLQKKSGPCNGHFIRYFYNKSRGSCSRFNYSGCGGNRNNFRSLKECQTICLT